MRILITGGTGLLGSNLKKFFHLQNNEWGDIHTFAPDRKILNIQDPVNVKHIIKVYNPDVIIHCAAIAKFKDAEENPKLTISTNIKGTCNLVEECIENNIRFIYISTSHVFDGNKGLYKHTDKVNPLTKYAKSKVAGELATLIHENSLVIRTEFCGEDFPFEVAFTDKYSSKEYIDIITPKIGYKCIGTQIGICHVGGPRLSFYEFGKLRNPSVKPGSVKNLVQTSKVPILIDTSLINN